jgi:hypothetical protein
MHARGEVSERTPMRVRPDARSMSSPSAHTAMRARSRARTQSRRAPHWPSQSGTLMAEDDRSLAACAFPPDTALNTRLWTGPRPAPIHGNRQIYSSARVGRSLVALHRSFTHQVYPALITTCSGGGREGLRGAWHPPTCRCLYSAPSLISSLIIQLARYIMLISTLIIHFI